MLLSLLKLCQPLPTASYTNLAIGIIGRLEDALSFSTREETNLGVEQKKMQVRNSLDIINTRNNIKQIIQTEYSN